MNLLRTLPKVDKFITHPLLASLNKTRVLELAKVAIEALRQGILEGEIGTFREVDGGQNLFKRLHGVSPYDDQVICA